MENFEESIDDIYFIEGKHLSKTGRFKIFLHSVYKYLKSLLIKEKILCLYEKGRYVDNPNEYLSIYSLDKPIQNKIFNLLNIMYGSHGHWNGREFKFIIKTNERIAHLKVGMEEILKHKYEHI